MKGLLAAALCSLALGGCSASRAADGGPVEVRIEHSAFVVDRSVFEPGDRVTFTIVNDDPIDHEFILGDDSVHAKHEEGVERHHHGDVPGEVSVPAGETRTTTFTFDDEGKLMYACHLPGHFDYGMSGTFTID